MFSLKNISCLGMIERLRIKAGDARIFADMLLVAVHALPRGRAEMIAVPRIDCLLDFLMTGKALRTADFPPNFMTLGAVLRSLQLPMGPGEISGRKLREG